MDPWTFKQCNIMAVLFSKLNVSWRSWDQSNLANDLIGSSSVWKSSFDSCRLFFHTSGDTLKIFYTIPLPYQVWCKQIFFWTRLKKQIRHQKLYNMSITIIITSIWNNTMYQRWYITINKYKKSQLTIFYIVKKYLWKVSSEACFLMPV